MFSRNRIYWAGGVLTLLLIALLIGRQFLFSHPNRVGAFRVPELAGWQMTSTENQRVQFKKTIQDTKLSLAISFSDVKVGNLLPRTVEDLQKDEQKDRLLMAGRAARFNAQEKILVEGQSIPFHDMPAIFSQQVTTTKNFTAQNKGLRFTDGKNLYIVNLSVSSKLGIPPSPAAQEEAEQAWKTVTEGLEPA